MKVTVLGCGASLGTPGAGGFWGKCDPGEIRNHRTRASILVQSETTNILVDATVDLRTHLNSVNLKSLDGVLISHAHSDHVNGLDDLRAISYHNNKLLDIYGNHETLEEMERRWPYLFRPMADGIYVEFLKKNMIDNYQKLRIGDIDVESFEQDHMTCASLGFRFGKVAYSVDIAELSEQSLEALEGVETWIVDAAGYQREAVLTHANIQRVKKWVERLKPKMTYLTVLSSHMDYKTLCDELPPHIRPAYDGMVIDTEGNVR
ncbi:MAG: MBL fold metallo-hydrolase [Alphaproteobacteria bacterium]|nr:MBL fold metallo-hydrolase [Alphaproteobacteria bacterium]